MQGSQPKISGACNSPNIQPRVQIQVTDSTKFTVPDVFRCLTKSNSSPDEGLSQTPSCLPGDPKPPKGFGPEPTGPPLGPTPTVPSGSQPSGGGPWRWVGPPAPDILGTLLRVEIVRRRDAHDETHTSLYPSEGEAPGCRPISFFDVRCRRRVWIVSGIVLS